MKTPATLWVFTKMLGTVELSTVKVLPFRVLSFSLTKSEEQCVHGQLLGQKKQIHKMCE